MAKKDTSPWLRTEKGRQLDWQSPDRSPAYTGVYAVVKEHTGVAGRMVPQFDYYTPTGGWTGATPLAWARVYLVDEAIEGFESIATEGQANG